MGRKSIIKIHILELLGQCGCMSKQAIDLLPYSYSNKMNAIHDLIAQGAIRKHGKGADKYYTLLDAGRKMLLEIDPIRYSPDKLPDQAVINRHPQRAKVLGDTQAFLDLAGFSVHPDDKPELPADCQALLEADNPCNCYFTSSEIKAYFADVNHNGLSYSRATGALLTPDNLYRVYNTRDVALLHNPTGEKKLKLLLPHLYRNYQVQGDAVLVVGDSGFRSARNILHNSWPENKHLWQLRQDKDKRGELLDVSNLGNPLHFIPLCTEMLPILRIARYPGGWEFLNTWVMNWLEQEWEAGNGIYYAVTTDDKLPHFLGCTLNLTALKNLIAHVDRINRRVAIVCANWQEMDLKELVAEHVGSDEAFDRIQWRTIDNDFFEGVAEYLDAFHSAADQTAFPDLNEFLQEGRFRLLVR